MTERDERLRALSRGRDETARAYDRYFVPRFAPWVHAAADAVARALSFAMAHEDATFWDAAASSGPFRALAAARDDFLRAAPAGRWSQRPRARWLDARR
ncbi:MAG TPA: hypothetical protein VFS43_10370 [Polyangiaceae bacterium]|nr:hypothetical protein [Polyangiaceae bacterium]